MISDTYLCASLIKNPVIKYREQWGVKVTLSKMRNSAIDVNLALSLFHLCSCLRHVMSLDLSARLSGVFVLAVWSSKIYLPLRIVVI